MFGYVKPYVPELKVKQHELYKAIYCSLCKQQKKLTGSISAFSLSYDFVFLALLRGAVTNEAYDVVDSRCAFNPLKKKKCISRCSSIDYTACVASLLTYYKLDDDVKDTRGFKRIEKLLAKWLLSGVRKKALGRVSLPEDEIIQCLEELSALEKSECPSVDECANVFGKLLSSVGAYGVDDPIHELILCRVFYHIGRWIYIVDAVDDYPRDIKTGSFNPFRKDGLNYELIDNCLQGILNEADKYILKVQFTDVDISDIIKNIIYLGTNDIEKQVFSRTEKNLSEVKGRDK